MLLLLLVIALTDPLRIWQGRLVVGGNRDWFYSETSASMTAFVANAVTWLAAGNSAPAVSSRDSARTPFGFDGAAVGVPTSALAGSAIDVYCMVNDNKLTAQEAADVLAFVAAGGGLLIADKAYNWKSNNGFAVGDLAVQYPSNAMIGPMGIVIGDRDRYAESSSDVLPVPAPDTNFLAALQRLQQAGTSSVDLGVALNTLVADSALLLGPSTAGSAAFDAVNAAAASLYRSAEDSVVFDMVALPMYKILLAQVLFLR